MATKDLMVEARKVRRNFSRLEVLKGINMEAPHGTITCLTGSSGSDKSTLLRCINHPEKANTDRLYVDGSLIGYREKDSSLYEISVAEAMRRRRDIGMMSQNFNPFPHHMALENITKAPVLVKGVSQEQAERRATELLKTVGLAHKADTHLIQLSGDQQQRAIIT